VSFSHPARFTLVGTMNPEEGELRPQLLDRFGLCVNIEGITDSEARVAIMERRSEFEEYPAGFCKKWEADSRTLVERIKHAIDLYPQVTMDRAFLYEIASYCLDVGVDGHRGDIIIMKAAKTLAAYNGRLEVIKEDIDAAAELALPHRIRRQPLQDIVVDIEQLRYQKKARKGTIT
jgi:magnesium chelatase subunit I